VPAHGTIVVALLFETERAPFVVKNPSFGKTAGGAVSLEVPWREGTAVRSAHRSDLIQVLSPQQRAPHFDVLAAMMQTHRVNGVEPDTRWTLQVELYVVPGDENTLVIPFHRCSGWIHFFGSDAKVEFDEIRLGPPYSAGLIGINRTPPRNLSLTVNASSSEVLIDGPGKVLFHASVSTPGDIETPPDEIRFQASLAPVGLHTPVLITGCLAQPEAQDGSSPSWLWKTTTDRTVEKVG